MNFKHIRTQKDKYKSQGSDLIPQEHKALVLQRAFEVYFDI